MPGTRRAVLGLAFLYLLLTVGALGTRDLWAPDEPRFAQIGREMLRSGDLVLPRMNGEPVALLPPLYYWVTAAAGAVAGDVTPAAARAGSALGGALVLLAVFGLARAWWDARRAFLAGLVLLTSLKFWHQSIWSQVDLLVTGFITLAIVSFRFAYESEGNPDSKFENRKSKIAWALAGFSFMALGTLTKGPLAVATPGLVFLVLIVVERRWRFLDLRWIAPGILLYAGLVAPWYVLACRRGGEAFTQEMIFKHNFGMFFDTWSHKQPPYYYLLHLPWMFAPWFLFLPAAVKLDCGMRNADCGWKGTDKSAIRNPPSPLPELRGTGPQSEIARRRFLWIWFLALFLFFSVSEAKQHKYLLPAFPPLVLIVADALAGIGDGRARRWRIPLGILSAASLLFLAGAVVIRFTPGLKIPVDPDLEGSVSAFVGPTLALGLGLALTWGVAPFAAARRPGAVVPLVAAGAAVACLVTAHGIFPALNPLKSAREFCDRTRARLHEGDAIGIYGIQFRQIGAYVYYTDRKLETFEDAEEKPDPAKLAAFWETQTLHQNAGAALPLPRTVQGKDGSAEDAEKKRRFCFIQDDDYAKLPDDLRDRMVKLDEESVGHRTLYLVATPD